ncbi:C-terminal binding protein [Planctomicrobium piriforme]|uniref:D-3-phosphoglycerate dehydrogenase n=1 Tax=Planctomicrobium piriforme TaxID=1576369 RepID=A0A1I3KUW9_9PLAN|nr:C-terminal binding protein [Planctomicrobium piriforme]SFI75915.1 D-3-phosphoglycerate dehydrogenase [Planctomicrobium piriforme]
MPNHRVLITDHPWPGIEIEQRLLKPYGVEIVDAPDGSEATLMHLATNVDAIATCWAKVTSKVIEAAQNCQIICRMGIGLDNIHIPTATEKGILVTNIPDYCVEEVADHALGLLLAVIRNIGFFHLRTKRGEYDLKAGPTMHRLRGRTLGLVGFGRTGQAMYERGKACGLNVIASTPSQQDYGTGCKMVSMEELIANSDYISLHSPLTDKNHHLFNRETLAKTKKGVVIVNTSRGPLIDPAALWEAIQSGQVGGAGLDVFDPEPPSLADPLYGDERVVVTPHAAFVSEESLIEMRERVAQQIAAVLQGETPENVRNPQVLENR